MNGAHLHLMFNHVPLFTLFFGLVSLTTSMWRKSPDLRVMASTLFVLAAVFGLIAFESGEKAEEVLKTLGGDLESVISPHEQAALWALRSCIFVGGLALVQEWTFWRKKPWAKKLQWALILFALHGCTVFTVTSLHGGKIRHTEIRN